MSLIRKRREFTLVLLSENTKILKKTMRDRRFIAEHRGGLLNVEQHRQFNRWGCDCARHVLSLMGEKTDERLINALIIGKEWEIGNATVGEARKASLDCITLANELTDPVFIAVARAVGHAVATAHMADHALGAALYALKAIKLSGNSIDEERKWQNDRLPFEIRELVLITRGLKEKALKIVG